MCQDRPAIAGTALPPPGALETDPVFVLMMGIRLLNLRNLCRTNRLIRISNCNVTLKVLT